MTGRPTTHDDTITEVRANCPDEATAAVIADRIVGERLAAAVNIHAPISIRYHYETSGIFDIDVALTNSPYRTWLIDETEDDRSSVLLSCPRMV